MIELRHYSRYIVLADGAHLGDGVTPHRRTGGKIHHLSRDCDLNLDAAVIVNFLQLLEASAENVIDVGTAVVELDLGKLSARAKSVGHRVGHEITRINCPTVILIETELFR